MHLKHDIKCLSAELPYTVDHGDFEIDLLYDIVDMDVPRYIRCQCDTQMFVFAASVCNVTIKDEWK